jgi:hypothetical protein
VGRQSLQLSAVILARVLVFIDIMDLSPRGRVFLPEIGPAIVDRYKFQKFPQTYEAPDESKGLEFYEGKFKDKTILKFAIWSSLLVVETRSSTEDSEYILEDILMWGADKFGLNYKTGMIKRFGYVSALTFYSDIDMLEMTTAVSQLSLKTGELLSDIWQEPIRYDTTIVTMGHDPLTRKYTIAPFTIQRRAEAKFSENKYFSEAPIPTDKHLQFLAEYEKDILAGRK